MDDLRQVSLVQILRVPEKHAQNDRSEDPDAVGGEILKKPRNRSQDCRPAILFAKQLPEFRFVPLGLGLVIRNLDQADFFWILGIAPEE